MRNKKITLLDGTRAGERNLGPALVVLKEELMRMGAEVQVFTMREIKLAHCIGCFGCWVETPGLCVEADAGRDICKAVISSQTVVLFTPVCFGGYSSELKRMVERLIPLVLPYFTLYQGEVHHNPRYPNAPRLVGIGVQQYANSEEGEIFKTLVARNAINFHTPHYAAEVVADTDSPETLRRRFADALSKSQYAPVDDRVMPLLPVFSTSVDLQMSEPGKALLIVGSPKTKSPSASGILGDYLLQRLGQQGWQTESLTLKASLRYQSGQQELISAVDCADLLLLAFPLYVDSLPFLVTKALEQIALHREAVQNRRSQRLVAIVNNGFPEATQNDLALAICQSFARRSGIEWAGGLAMGAGEALGGGQPLTAPVRSGLPVNHVIGALDLAAAALAKGQPVPSEAKRMIARVPIPFLPVSLWRYLFLKMGNRYWRQRASRFGVSKSDLLAQPLAQGQLLENQA